MKKETVIKRMKKAINDRLKTTVYKNDECFKNYLLNIMLLAFKSVEMDYYEATSTENLNYIVGGYLYTDFYDLENEYERIINK